MKISFIGGGGISICAAYMWSSWCSGYNYYGEAGTGSQNNTAAPYGYLNFTGTYYSLKQLTIV